MKNKQILTRIAYGALASVLLALWFLWPRAPKPAGTVVAVIKGARFTLDRMESPAARGYGLKGARGLDSDRGAFFRDPKRPLSVVVFVMDGCKIPLDMIFLDQAGNVQRIETARPGAPEAFTVAGPIQRSSIPASRGQMPPSWAVLEIRAGRAAELGLKPGDSISFEPPFSK